MQQRLPVCGNIPVASLFTVRKCVPVRMEEIKNSRAYSPKKIPTSITNEQ